MNANISWIFLLIAGAFEVAWVVALKYSHGFTRLAPSISMVAALFLACFFVACGAQSSAWNVLRGMDGHRDGGRNACGAVLFAEAANPMQIFFAALIVVGIAGVKFAAD